MRVTKAQTQAHDGQTWANKQVLTKANRRYGDRVMLLFQLG